MELHWGAAWPGIQRFSRYLLRSHLDSCPPQVVAEMMILAGEAMGLLGALRTLCCAVLRCAACALLHALPCMAAVRSAAHGARPSLPMHGQ